MEYREFHLMCQRERVFMIWRLLLHFSEKNRLFLLLKGSLNLLYTGYVQSLTFFIEALKDGL